MDKSIYLIYYKETGELYAFTEKKSLYKLFKKTRNMSMYFCKKIDYETKTYSNLYKKHQDLSIFLFKFNKISLPLTHVESNTIINITTNFTISKIYTLPFVCPDTLNNKYKIYLKRLLYDKVYNVFKNKGEPIEIEEDYFKCFLLYYEKILDGNAILDLYEKGEKNERNKNL